MFFSSSQVVIWPKSHSLEIYLNKKDNNHFVFEYDLWQPLSAQDIQSIQTFFKTLKRSKIFLIIPNEVLVTKSFVYESNIESINREEILAMAKPSVDFEINPDLLSFKLEQNNSKTIIRATLIDSKKIDILKENLSKIGIKISDYQPLSHLISNVIFQFFQQEYCLLYPNELPQYLFILAQGQKIYLTDVIKASSLDINKKINYSDLYFGKTAEKLFTPNDFQTDLKINDKVTTNPFNESQISAKYNKPSNLPLPVLSFFNKDLYNQLTKNTDIIKLPTLESYQAKPDKMMEEPKTKNPLVIFIVFVVSLVLVSLGLWFLMNKPKGDVVSPSSNQNQPEEITPIVVEEEPTSTPTPEVTVKKDIKIKILNATDINGQAALVKTSLAELDFTDVTTGNSTEDITVNTVRYKPSLESVPTYIQQNLSSFTDAKFESTLKETDTYDMILIIGEKLTSSSQTPSSTSTPSATIKPTE